MKTTIMEITITVNGREINEDSETSLIIPTELDTLEVLTDLKKYLQDKYIKKSKPAPRRITTDTNFDEIPF